MWDDGDRENWLVSGSKVVSSLAKTKKGFFSVDRSKIYFCIFYLLVAKVVEITVRDGTGVTTIRGGSVETKAEMKIETNPFLKWERKLENLALKLWSEKLDLNWIVVEF